jgi:hypothetical protein
MLLARIPFSMIVSSGGRPYASDTHRGKWAGAHFSLSISREDVYKLGHRLHLLWAVLLLGPVVLIISQRTHATVCDSLIPFYNRLPVRPQASCRGELARAASFDRCSRPSRRTSPTALTPVRASYRTVHSCRQDLGSLVHLHCAVFPKQSPRH